MVTNEYTYALVLMKRDGTPLGQWAVPVDFEPARACAAFTGLRAGRLEASQLDARGTVEPLWHDTLGAPYITGFQIIFDDNCAPASRQQFPTLYFVELARAASTDLVRSGRLEPGEHFHYVVAAFRPEHPAGKTPPRFTVAAAPSAVAVVASPDVAGALAAARPQGEGDDNDVPVLVPERVLTECIELTRAAGANETGGVLIGHLLRDEDSSDLVVAVTAQIPAKHARSGLTHLTFTAETWAAVKAAIDLRRKAELRLGWWHCHTFLKASCKDCERAKEHSCSASAAFFSAQDETLHRTVFPAAFTIGLVISDSPCAGLQHTLFGWRDGHIAQRAFNLTPNDARAPAAQPCA